MLDKIFLKILFNFFNTKYITFSEKNAIHIYHKDYHPRGVANKDRVINSATLQINFNKNTTMFIKLDTRILFQSINGFPKPTNLPA